MPDASCYRVSARTGWPGVSLLCLGEIAYLFCCVCLNVASAVSLSRSSPEIHFACWGDVNQAGNIWTAAQHIWLASLQVGAKTGTSISVCLISQLAGWRKDRDFSICVSG